MPPCGRHRRQALRRAVQLLAELLPHADQDAVRTLVVYLWATQDRRRPTDRHVQLCYNVVHRWRNRTMAKRESISISFTPEQAGFLTSLVERGEYQSVSEVVRAALRPFQRRQAVLDAEIDRARRVIEAGADQLDQGLIVDGDAFFEEWDAELDELEVTSQQRTG